MKAAHNHPPCVSKTYNRYAYSKQPQIAGAMLGISAQMIFKCDLYATLTELRAVIRLCNVA
jgi:hypothetical protein